MIMTCSKNHSGYVVGMYVSTHKIPGDQWDFYWRYKVQATAINQSFNWVTSLVTKIALIFFFINTIECIK